MEPMSSRYSMLSYFYNIFIVQRAAEKLRSFTYGWIAEESEIFRRRSRESLRRQVSARKQRKKVELLLRASYLSRDPILKRASGIEFESLAEFLDANCSFSDSHALVGIMPSTWLGIFSRNFDFLPAKLRAICESCFRRQRECFSVETCSKQEEKELKVNIKHLLCKESVSVRMNHSSVDLLIQFIEFLSRLRGCQFAY